MRARWLLVLAGALTLAGCTGGPSDRQGRGAADGKAGDKSSRPQDEEAEIKAALAKLSPEDQKLAEAQRFCAVQGKNRLGSMGMPFKVLVQDQPVFLCCKGCRKKALADPDKTLAKVNTLRKRAAAGAPEK